MRRSDTEIRRRTSRGPRSVASPHALAVLWRELDGRHMLGYAFERAYRIGRHRVDFYCEALHFAVDVEPIIASDARLLRDRSRRANSLRHGGIRLMQFSDDEVMHNLDGVIVSIRRSIRNQPEHWAKPETRQRLADAHRSSLPRAKVRLRHSIRSG